MFQKYSTIPMLSVDPVESRVYSTKPSHTISAPGLSSGPTTSGISSSAADAESAPRVRSPNKTNKLAINMYLGLVAIPPVGFVDPANNINRYRQPP